MLSVHPILGAHHNNERLNSRLSGPSVHPEVGAHHNDADIIVSDCLPSVHSILGAHHNYTDVSPFQPILPCTQNQVHTKTHTWITAATEVSVLRIGRTLQRH